MANENLGSARSAKNDEFYTQFQDIEKEMNAYLDFDADVFRGKTVLLPCDDPEWSNFTKYFAQNFELLGLKKLISTSYAPNSKPQGLTYQPTLFEFDDPAFDERRTVSNGKIISLTRDANNDNRINVDDLEWRYLEGDGDFRSDEVTLLRDEADIIVTNPPFSKFIEFIDWIVEAEKKFVILGNMNAITYKEVFALIKGDKIWSGTKQFGGGMDMIIPNGLFEIEKAGVHRIDEDGEIIKNIMGVIWFTNIDHGRRHQPIPLMTMEDNIRFSKHKEVKDIGYQHYDSYDAIEVPFTDAIPIDYEGVMGVPISFLGKYNPEQFEILSLTQTWSDLPTKKYPSQVLVDPKGGRKTVGALNSSTAIKVPERPHGVSHYEVDGEFFISTYKRILIRHRKGAV